jgi:hypothetical protein
MTAAPWFRFCFVRLLPLLVLGLLGARAIADSDPPSRVARINHAQGTIVLSPAGDDEWTDAEPNRPLTRGDRLWTDRGSRAEIQVGSSAVRMDGSTHLVILTLDDQAAQLSVTQGSLYVHVRSLPEGENFEIDTPNLAYRAAYPGDYRIDVDAGHGTTRVTIHSGTGAVYGEAGQVLALGGGQQITFHGRDLSQLNAQESPPQDNFDRWAADRNRREDQSLAARHVPREVVGYQQLDAYGQWQQDATYGAVWIPQGTPANWAPYRNGHWEWIAPWGWTWMDDAPWGFAPFHYGRWAMAGTRWAWVPGHIGLKPVYAPALVAFIGGSSGGVNWSLSIGAGKPGVAWFPLAPGEPLQPGYHASPVYMSNLNANMAVQGNPSYAHQRRPEALTAISAEDFHRGRPIRGNWLRVAANSLSNAQVMPPPPMPDRSGIVDKQVRAVARVAPPAQADVRQLIANAAQARASEASDRAQRQAQAAQAQAEAQAKAARAAQTQAQEQARQEQHAKRLEQAHRQQVARRAERARLEQQARREQARRELLAKRAEKAERAKREEQARRAEQAKREALARVDEKLRQEAHAAQLQHARRAAEHDAQALREQRARREEQAKRDAEREQAQREQAQREASLRQQQAVIEQSRRDREQWEQQQRDRNRNRPDLRDDRRSRGLPILNSGPLS